MKNEIVSQITTECPWRDTLLWYETIDSTNNQAKILAKDGVPHGTVLVAQKQSGGRGRMGRSFLSPTGGVYLSVILRPACTPDKLMHLTCATAVAGCKAVENACGISPDVKWTNDLVVGRKKLGGILTELALNGVGVVDYAIVGIGINCCQQSEDFPEEIRELATSVQAVTGNACSPAKLAASLIEALWEMDKALLSQKAEIMDAYRKKCITLGKEISVLRGESVRHGTALDLDEDGGLVVRFSDGSEKVVTSGEVSVRGMYGYL
ncbi:MAG: biotin--[Oscillospiraceae bacterium]|nr:biotin--[acetyl-CoA-carboxylase] ligase [Oscillospiraceae bacterium]